MNTNRPPPLAFFFILASIALVFSPLWVPSIRLTAFAPFLAITFQRKGLLTSLWLATVSGLFIDLCNSHTPFGIFSLISLLTASITYRFHPFFFEENPFSIPLYAALISFVFASLQMLFTPQPFSFQLPWILVTFLFLPIIDALYAFLWFSCPRILYTLFSPKPKFRHEPTRYR